MYNPTVSIIGASTTSLPLFCANAAALTQHGKIVPLNDRKALIERLYKSGHHAPFEFATCTLYLTGVSRAFLAQITRHRHFSFMSTSQHYQDYGDYPIVCSNSNVEETSAYVFNMYKHLLDSGIPRHEARMCLPNSAGVNLLMSGNARAWADMLRTRLCERNVPEMVKVARLMHKRLYSWFPALFVHVNASCKDKYMNGCREMKPCGKNGE